MAIKSDTKYAGTVRSGSSLIETQTGSLGFQVMLACSDGETSFTIWLTEKNIARARKVFTDSLGIPAEKLRNGPYVQNQLATDITGREVSFGTKTEEYNGKKSIKVAWLGKKSASASGESLGSAAARLFAGGPKEDADPITDDDLPDDF